MRLVAALPLAAALSLLCPALPRADKLVQFHNGRTLRVQSTRQDGEWTYLTLGRRSEFAVPARLIATITEAAGKAPEPISNVVISAAGAGAPAPGGARQPAAGVVAAEPPAEDASFADPGAAGDGGGASSRRRGAATARRTDREGVRPTSKNALLRPPAPIDLSAGTTGKDPNGQPPPGQGGADLAGSPGASSAWPSLLDRNRQGRKGSNPGGGSGSEDGSR